MNALVTPMSIEHTTIDGLTVIGAKAVTDDRGTVREFFRQSSFDDSGLQLPSQWSQVNMTWTAYGALRGLHGERMTKLIGLAYGAAFGVYLDSRPGSTTQGRVVTVALDVGLQVLVPPGVCNGFQATSTPGCQYVYCFDVEWSADMTGVAVNPLDPKLDIAWPIAVDRSNTAQISAKDAAAPGLADALR